MFAFLRRGGPAYLPVNNRSGPPRDSKVHIPYLVRNGSPTFLSLILAALLGALVGYNLLSRGPPDYYNPFSGSTELSDNPLDTGVLSPWPYIPPPRPASDQDKDHLTLEELREIAAQTKGFWVRDWSLHLGWNNMRYIIETALMHAALLNRTAVIPTFVYARSCEYDVEVCGDYVPMVNHGDAVGSDEWRKLPPSEQLSWRVPINVMLNLTLLRSTQPVITTAEYLRMHNLPEDIELSNGHWDREGYHRKPDKYGKKLSLAVIQNWRYDPEGTNRVDVIPEDMKKRGHWMAKGKGMGEWPAGVIKTAAYGTLEGVMGKNNPPVMGWDQARGVLRDRGYISHDSTDEEFTQFLHENGWEVLYTYQGAAGMDYVKNVVNPIRDIAPRDTLRGLSEDWGHFEEDVVLLEGEIHYTRKPASLRFTSAASRDVFTNLVLHSISATKNVHDLADKLAERMYKMSNGRMWMSAHMRRGDFIRTNWVMEENIEAHFNRIKYKLEEGRKSLRALVGSTMYTYDIPGAVADQSISRLEAPLDTDKYAFLSLFPSNEANGKPARFYLATDERDPGNMQYLADHGAVLVASLLTHEDRQQFGWALLLTDVLGLVEQAVLAKSSYFYAHALSSYAGGTVNLRAAAGLDPRTAVID
ncbi:hypothetical protein HWV62_13747 [Athelia sp. TMB]|nr:hypothetical protein HWV62_13747 [Athelia sp. TMB]